MTPTGYVAKCAVDVATAKVRPVPTAMVDAIGELLAARFQVQKFSTLVNQAVAKWHATDELPPELMRAVALVGRILPQLEAAAVAVRGAHGGGPLRAVQAPGRRARPAPEAGSGAGPGAGPGAGTGAGAGTAAAAAAGE